MRLLSYPCQPLKLTTSSLSLGGLGRELVLALLARDIPVVATARKLESIKDLEAKGARIAQWDVTDPLARLQATAAELDAQVGGVGVLVNKCVSSRSPHQ